MNEDYADVSCGLRQFPKQKMPVFPDTICLAKGTLENDMPFWVLPNDVAAPENCDRVISDNLADLAARSYEVLWALWEHLPKEVFGKIYEDMTGETLKSKDHT